MPSSHPRQPRQHGLAALARRPFLLLGLLTASGASLAEPPPPPAPPRPIVLDAGWEAQAERLPASDRSGWRQHGLGSSPVEAFRLGPYAVDEVRRSAVSTEGFTLGPFGRTTERWDLRFRFEAATAWDGRCDSRRQSSLTSRLGLLPDAVTTLRCRCTGGSQVAELSLSDEWRPAHGELRIDGQVLQMQIQDVPGHEIHLASPAPAFLVSDASGAQVAALETLQPGRAWRSPSLAPEAGEALACLFAGVLLRYPD